MHHRLRRPRPVISDIGTIIVYLGLAVPLLSMDDHPGSRICRSDLGGQRWGAALGSCTAELVRAHDPQAALGAARAALYLGRYDEVISPATAALESRYAADAYMLLGSALFRQAYVADDNAGAQQRLYISAQAHLSTALALHAGAGDARGIVSDAQQLASLWRDLGDYEAALADAALARSAASTTARAGLSAAADFAMVDILLQIGRYHEAEAIISGIDERSLDAYHRPWLFLKRGYLHLGTGNWRLARDPLTRALFEERASRSPRPELVGSALMNLSFVERKAGATDKALEYLEESRSFGAEPMDYHLNRGLALADAGRLREAATELAAAEAAGPKGHWGPWVALQRALVAIKRGDRASAMTWLRLAIDRVNVLARGSASWVPSMIAQNREPHLELVGLHAASGEWREILDVIAEMDAQALLSSTASATDLAPSSIDPPQSPDVLRRPPRPPVRQIIEAWRGRRLVVVVPGGTRVWRIELPDRGWRADSSRATTSRGVSSPGDNVRGYDIGDRRELADLALRLESQPLDAEAGRQLGEALLPTEIPDGSRVELLVIGPIARAPLAGLRHGSSMALARWELVRVPGILPWVHVDRRNSDKVVLLADPRPPGTGWTLPAARQKALASAALVRGTALVGAAATRAALLGALDAHWLHIATRTSRATDGTALMLHDGAVTARTIAASPAAPSVVVLASCDTAVGEDDDGNGSLANAFLDAGTDTVIATRWLIEDTEAAGAVAGFYELGPVRDPIAALRAMQLSPPSNVPPRAWAAFEAFSARPHSKAATAP